MDWLFETPWTLWVALALVFAVIEMLSLDLFFLMLAISAGITAAISPFVDNMLIRTVIFVVICLILVLGLRPPLLKSSINQLPALLLMPKRSLVLRCASLKM